MAIAKIMGGDSVQMSRLYRVPNVVKGTKNLAQSNTFRKIARLEKEMNEGKITEEEFAEQQSDILTDFVEQWGDPTPPSEETPEQKTARKERKAKSKAEEEKYQITLIAENGFIEEYTIILTGDYTQAESDHIKALDDPTTEVYKATYKPFVEYLKYHYGADYGTELKLLTVLDEGEKSGLLHIHSMLNTPFKITDAHSQETKRFLEWIEDRWKHYSGATVARAEVAYKIGGVWAFAPYMSKCFFDCEKHKKNKHYYWRTDNLKSCLTTEKKEIPDDGFNRLIAKLRNNEDEAVAYIEDSPEMENKRVINMHFHDAEDRIDDITFVDITIANVTKDIEEGRLNKKRSAADVEIWADNVPMFSRVKHYSEDAMPEEPKIPFDERKWVKDNGWKSSPSKKQQCCNDNAQSAPSLMPRQRKIMSLGITWFENLPVPQAGHRIVQSNGLIFDELDTTV